MAVTSALTPSPFFMFNLLFTKALTVQDDEQEVQTPANKLTQFCSLKKHRELSLENPQTTVTEKLNTIY